MSAADEVTHKATKELGPSVVDNELVWSSASGLTTADPNSVGGCLRKWWYEQVGGKRQPSTEAQKKGTALHDEIEQHLTKGAPLLSQLAIAGRGFIPEPGPGLLIEQPLAVGKDGKITGAWLHARGNGRMIPMAGHVDLWNHRGAYIDKEGELRRDPPRTLETKDWKTTSDLQYAKTPAELAQNIQLITYAEGGFRMWPDLEHARLTHVYFRTRGRPESKLVTILVDREHVTRRWEYAEGVARTAADAAREINPDKVEANTAACGAYRGCPHRAYCRAGSQDSLSQILGPRGAEAALNRLQQIRGEFETMSLIDKLKPGALTAPAAPPSPAVVQPMPASAGVGVSVTVAPSSVDAEVAALQAQEAARRAQAAAGIPNGFADAIAYLQSAGRGWPTFTGRAAAAIASLTGSAPTAEIAGTGWLATKCQPVEDPEVVIRLVNEVRTLPPIAAEPTVVAAPPPPAPAPTPPPPAPAPVASMLAAPTPPPPAISVLPPDAPASNPAMAAHPVEGLDNEKTRQLAALTSPTIPGLAETATHVAATGSLLAPAPTPAPPAPAAAPSLLGTSAPVVTPTPLVPPTPTPTVTEVAETVANKRRPGRPKGTSKKKAETPPAPSDGTPTPAEEQDTAISLFVNAIPSAGFESLHPYVDELCAALCAEYSAADVRCAPKDGPLGFGKWQGAVAALARRSPPPAGSYYVNTRGNDIAAIVADALRAKVVESGGLYVEGVA